MFYDDADEEG